MRTSIRGRDCLQIMVHVLINRMNWELDDTLSIIFENTLWINLVSANEFVMYREEPDLFSD